MSFVAKRLEATTGHDVAGHSTELIRLERFVVRAIKASRLGDRLPSYERERLVVELLEGHSNQPAVLMEGHLSAYQRDKVARVPDAIARLKRSSRRGVSISAVAAHIGVDRGTLTRWITLGLVSLDD